VQKTETEEVRRKLRTYRALDHDLRLKAYVAINEQPRLSFNELSRKLKIARGLMAYHLGVLKAANLINVNYVRRSKETSEYELTKEGKKTLKELSYKTKSRKAK